MGDAPCHSTHLFRRLALNGVGDTPRSFTALIPEYAGVTGGTSSVLFLSTAVVVLLPHPGNGVIELGAFGVVCSAYASHYLAADGWDTRETALGYLARGRAANDRIIIVEGFNDYGVHLGREGRKGRKGRKGRRHISD